MAIKTIPELVTPEWLQAQFKATGLQVNDVANITHVDRTNISSWINGSRKMSAGAKAMFYFFFRYWVIKRDEVRLQSSKDQEKNAFLDGIIEEIEKL